MGEENKVKPEKNSSEPPADAISFSAADLFSSRKELQGVPQQKPQDPIAPDFQVPPFLKNIFDKIVSKKTYLAYVILFIILIVAVLPRLYTTAYPSLYSTDSFWQYRHANEIYEHGYPGTEIRPLAPDERAICWKEPACTWDRKSIYWDSLHDAPEGGAAPIEAYQYFVAYSYKYLAKLFFPTLFDWIRVTPILLILLTTIVIFLIGKEALDAKAGLAAAGIYVFSITIVIRTVYGYSDSDGLILLFFTITTYLFFKAWSKKSYLYGGLAGLSLGFTGFSSPSSYVFLPIMLIAASSIFFAYRFFSALFSRGSTAPNPDMPGQRKSIKAIFSEIIKEDYKNYLILLLAIGLGMVFVAIVESPLHANIAKTTLNLLGAKATERAVAAGTRNVFLTVQELAGLSLREIIYSTHLSVLILLAIFVLSLPFKLKREILRNPFYTIFLALFFGIMLFASTKATRSVEFFLLPAALFAGFAVSDLIGRLSSKKLLSSMLVILLLLGLFFFLPNIPFKEGNFGKVGTPYFQSAFKTGQGALTFAFFDNPLNFLKFYDWAKQDTKPGEIFLSWWDHGHQVTAISERPVVVDGSQNFEHVNDVAKFLITANLTEALSILKKYNASYVFTSSDLVGKYASISYIAEGSKEIPLAIPLSSSYQLQNNTTNYVYGFKNSPLQIVATVNKEGDANAVIVAKYNSTKIGRVYYSSNPADQVIKLRSNEGDLGNFINATIYFTPTYDYAMPLPANFESSMLISLQLLDGLGLEDNFKLIKNFNGTVKVFKVIY